MCVGISYIWMREEMMASTSVSKSLTIVVMIACVRVYMHIASNHPRDIYVVRHTHITRAAASGLQFSPMISWKFGSASCS